MNAIIDMVVRFFGNRLESRLLAEVPATVGRVERRVALALEAGDLAGLGEPLEAVADVPKAKRKVTA